MNSRGGQQRSRGQEEEEEDFYDCQETLQSSNPKEEEQEEQREEKEDEDGQEQRVQEVEQEHREESQQDTPGLEDAHVNTERLMDRRDAETGGGEEEEEDDEEKEDEEENKEEEQQDDEPQADSDSEFQEEVCKGVEFDDDYLREVEKELTEEEKQSRRQQSLTLKETGNQHFKTGDWREAELSYTEALSVCPVCYSKERAVLFSNRAAARLHLDLKDQAIADCTKAIDLDPDYLRALLRRAELYEQTEKLDEALEDYNKVLECDPNNRQARQACMRLPQQIQERNEKLKEEMISKLKDLGNMFLRPFGLSTNNFQVNQDPSSGSYSINFVQGANNNNR
ncbi:tetratricopeptide repeat protein 1 [Cololabis saira]|uniref:tetratricopeptide repeat protein 1 n=1 Tax=Cololabis saira TaxID=129043 RepID=UPI002AD25393|nr:tetratricopeptide repeat protein 1 [Cololabis saira]